MRTARYQILDGIRGIALLNMIAYHIIWDLVYMYNFKWDWYQSESAYVWQQGICWTFIFLSGFCWPLGKHSLKRGLTIFWGGMVITVVTLVVMPQNRVVFGVLTLIGSCMLLMSGLDRWLRLLPPLPAMLVSLVFFGVTRNINEGWIGFERFNLLRLPDMLYDNMATTYLGFKQEGFYSTDYFSLFPWLFLFTAGYFLFWYLQKKGVLGVLGRSILFPVEWLGRHSFGVYMVHQPLIYLGLSFIF